VKIGGQAFCQKIEEAFAIHKVVAILGPRQIGKTTVTRQYIEHFAKILPRSNYFDLENIEDLIRLNQPQLAFSQLSGLIVIDEVQRKPELFPILRVLVDDPIVSRKFLILGSASGLLLRQSSESLAGRIKYLELTGFSSLEIDDYKTLWYRGSFPVSYLANSDEHSTDWRKSFIRTFLEQDIPNLGIKIAPMNLRRFWMLLAHYHGNICNLSEIGRLLGISDKTVHSYLDLLSATFMLRQLPAWSENIGKRQVKRPKIYLRDSGILHSLLDINNQYELMRSQKIGSSWEGFILEELIRYHEAYAEECFFWATQSQAELDLLIVKGSKKYAYEIKYTEQPQMTKSLYMALDALKLDKIIYIYPGNMNFMLHEKVFVTNIKDFFIQNCINSNNPIK
jgi:uncharacterized protein